MNQMKNEIHFFYKSNVCIYCKGYILRFDITIERIAFMSIIKLIQIIQTYSMWRWLLILRKVKR